MREILCVGAGHDSKVEDGHLVAGKCSSYQVICGSNLFTSNLTCEKVFLATFTNWNSESVKPAYIVMIERKETDECVSQNLRYFLNGIKMKQ